MKSFDFIKIDAFATNKSSGNPAGYIKLSSKEDITTNQMQKLARELKGFVNEVGFLFQNTEDILEFKYYSSEREVDFCGHATIAIMYDLIKNDSNLTNTETFTILTNRGVLKVENRIKDEDSVFIMSPVPYKKTVSLSNEQIADGLQIKTGEIDNALSVSVINAGLTTLIVPIKSLNSIIKIHPNIDYLKSFCISNDIDIIEVFTSDVSDISNDFRVRVFAPTFGYLEDPATGSGNSAFGYYLLDNNKFDKHTIVIEQNNNRENYNIVKLQKRLDEEGNERILFGGGAIKRIDGKYLLY